jgi:hypothetical protein
MQNMFENDRINQSSQSLIMDCHLCWRQTKGLIAAVTMIRLAGCQPATMSVTAYSVVNNSSILTNSTSVTCTNTHAQQSGSSNQTRPIINSTAQDGAF